MGGKRSRELLEAVDVGMRILLGNELRWHTSSVGTRILLGCRLRVHWGMQILLGIELRLDASPAALGCKLRWDTSSAGKRIPLGCVMRMSWPTCTTSDCLFNRNKPDEGKLIEIERAKGQTAYL
jgi:hypothetical protein